MTARIGKVAETFSHPIQTNSKPDQTNDAAAEAQNSTQEEGSAKYPPILVATASDAPIGAAGAKKSEPEEAESQSKK
jgi:hypothetical protein